MHQKVQLMWFIEQLGIFDKLNDVEGINNLLYITSNLLFK